MSIILVEASREQEPVIQNLIQLYTHDFSEFWSGTSKGDLLADGRFAPYPMAGYWTHPGWSASLIWRDTVLAGFVLINDQAHSGEPVAHSMAEFFILRKHRGCGVGRMAAEIALSRHPGPWEIAVARRNAGAGHFWRRLIADTAVATRIRELDVNTEHWDGPILRFEWRQA